MAEQYSAWLQLSFTKQRIVHPQTVRVGQPQRRGLNPSWLPHFICLLLPALSLPYANWTGQEGGKFVSPEVLTLVYGFSFLQLLWVFPFLCLLVSTILDYFFLF